jgi:hypothetical protein
MTDKVQGQPSQHKPFRVRRDADGSDILASSDTLEEAIADVRRRRNDWRYVILEIWTIVWPKDRAKGQVESPERRDRKEKAPRECWARPRGTGALGLGQD